MKKIADFLDKFAGLGQKERKEKEIVIEKIKSLLNVELKKEEIEIKDLKIRLKISGVQKTEIILNKNKILFEINKEIDQKIIELS